LRAGASIYVIHRLLRFHGVPTVLDEIHLPSAQFKGLDESVLRKHQGSFYGLLESQYSITMIRAEERIKAVRAEAHAAGLLGVEVGEALLCVDRVAFTYGDRPIELRRGLCKTEAYSYVNEIS
jgi:GntR family transcriptional regulator